MGEHFTPIYCFRINFDKGTPSRYFAEMFIFVLVPRNLIMSGVRRDSILGLLWKTAHILKPIKKAFQ